MPIKREEFDKGGFDPEDILLNFLRENENLAFTARELLEALHLNYRLALEEQRIQEILKGFLDKERIEMKNIRGVVYYTYRRTVGFRPRR